MFFDGGSLPCDCSCVDRIDMIIRMHQTMYEDIYNIIIHTHNQTQHQTQTSYIPTEF